MCFVLPRSALITVACLLSASCRACCNSQCGAGMFPCGSSIHTHRHAAHVRRLNESHKKKAHQRARGTSTSRRRRFLIKKSGALCAVDLVTACGLWRVRKMIGHLLTLSDKNEQNPDNEFCYHSPKWHKANTKDSVQWLKIKKYIHEKRMILSL